MTVFNHEQINFELLRERAFNFRWAEVAPDVIPLTAADPDFPVAKEIKEDLIDYINGGYFSYTPKLGIPQVRIDLAEALHKRKGITIAPEQILPIDSVARAMFTITQSLLQEGDEAIVFDPLDFLFKESIASAKAKAVYVPVSVTEDHLDLSQIEKAITPKTKMITLCNPHNPLGMLYRESDLRYLISLAKKYDLWIMNDEIWSDIVYSEKPFQSIVNLDKDADQRIVSTYGFSKSFGIAGLRAGIIYTQNQQAFEQIVQNSYVLTTAGGVTSLSQIAMQTCVNKCYYWTDQFVEYLQNNRDYALERMEAMPMIHCHKPYATYLLFPDITATGLSSEQFADYVLKKEKLAIVPGTVPFFGPGAEGHIRICYATSLEVLKEGLDRLERALHHRAKEIG